MRIVLIQAGGSGSRIRADIPKQFIDVNGKPIIAYTLEKFQNSSFVDDIYISCIESYCDKLDNICKEYGILKLKGIIKGGHNIFQSTKNCLSAMEYTEDPYVMIHEATRPLITDEIITDSFLVAEKYGNAVACTESIDESGYLKLGMVDIINAGRNLYTIQNPHTFKLSKLMWAYDGHEDIGNQGTAVLMYQLGETLYCSKGHPDCFKITYEEDIRRFKALLSLYFD